VGSRKKRKLDMGRGLHGEQHWFREPFSFQIQCYVPELRIWGETAPTCPSSLQSKHPNVLGLSKGTSVSLQCAQGDLMSA
jgi:hypothetical protein